MKISAAFPSKYLQAVDLQNGQDYLVTIESVALEIIDERTNTQKPVVHLVGAAKALVLNVTNANTITEMYGDETDLWAQKPIVLFATTTDFQGKRVPCIRVKMPIQTPAQLGVQTVPGAGPALGGPPLPPQPPAAPTPPAAPAGPADLDDEIPF